MTSFRPQTIDDILTNATPDQRAALEKLRRTIQATAPGAEECISYGLAAFRLNGRALVAFGATANHCAFYPMSGTLVEAHRAELARFETSKGTIRFQPDAPLPTAIVRKLVKARMAENAGVKPEPRRPAKPGARTLTLSPPQAKSRTKPSPPLRSRSHLVSTHSPSS
jgi:uncharacterized protein YdhG (YjbR/CyaY superfamily)